GIVLESLSSLLQPRAIVDRTPAAMARAEGFEPAAGVVRGAPIERLTFVERGLRYELPLELGQKTGFYLDQRPLLARIEQLAHGRRVLDTFCFVGTFAMAAARGGASAVVAVDQSALALEVAAECARANGLAKSIAFVRRDARKALQQ